MRKHVLRFASSVSAALAALLPLRGAAVDWRASFLESEAAAREHNVPMVLFVGAVDCSSCQVVDAALAEDSRFLDWANAHGEFVYCYVKGNSKNNMAKYLSNPKKYASLISEDLAAALNFTKGSVIPRVAFYWPGHEPDEKESFSCWKGYMPIKEPKDDTIGQLIACLNEFFADYKTTTAFGAGATSSDRLEVLPGADSVIVPVKRTSGFSRTIPTSLVVPATAATNRIDWAEGQSNAFVRVELPKGLIPGASFDLLLLGEDGEAQAQSSVWMVEEPETSPKNPLWIGERDAATLRPGEWTMDVDLAQGCAQDAKTASLTLVGGSLWCPDCVNADANLVETDVFRNWAEVRGVYCAALDVPSFPKNGQTCLLTYTAASVSDRYVNATVPPQDRVQSGAGYLSRKGIPQTGNGGTNATDILARNLNLVTNSVTVGGLCRPECLDAANTATFGWKTGVPCFLVRNAEGRIIGRLDQFSNVSPTNAAAASAYVRRFEEILALADDPTEELNAHWSTATTDDCALDVRGGTRSSTISAIDLSDYWRLTGRDHWTRTTISIKSLAPAAPSAESEDDIRLNFWKVANGKATKVASAAGSLASGVALPAQEIAPDGAADFFVQVEALATSAAFALDRDGASTVTYDLTAESVDDAGTLAFAAASATASEADAKKAGGTLRVLVPISRTGGATGATNATVAVDAASTAFPDRYRIVTDALSWADGELGTKSLAVDVLDDGNADGTQVLRLLLGATAFELTIVDNDKMAVGKLALAETEPALAKKGTVIAQEGARIRIGVARTGGASGAVAATLATTAGAFAAEPAFRWASRSSGTQWAELDLPLLADCPSGKVTVSFGELDGIKADSSAKTLTIQLIGATSPRFAADSLALDLVRYCAVSQEVAVANLADGAKAKVAKLSGSLPSGVSVKLVGGRLVISGTPSAKAGTYAAVYQVSQTVGRTTAPGLTIRLTFAVTDVAALDPSDPGANPSVAAKRTIPDVMVIDEGTGRLAGLVTGLTIPATGRCTAKYLCAAGRVSFKTKSWDSYDAATGTLSARLTVSDMPAYALVVTARADGSVELALTEPGFAATLTGEAPEAWSKANPATAWVGRATAAFLGAGEGGSALANGAPVVTLRLTESSAKTGKMQYAGFLPNGQAFSGTSVLVADGVDAVLLPICYRTAKDFFTAVLRLEANGKARAVSSESGVTPWWRHTEALSEACWEVGYDAAVGSWIDAKQNLLETVDPLANGHALIASGALDAVPVTISETAAKLDATAAKPVGASLSLNRTTGLVSGKFKTLDSAEKTVTANYRAVLLPDWGDGCLTCGGTPWAMGSFWISEKLTGEVNGKAKTISVKTGDALVIESVIEAN